jgi:hypothetical protein
MANFGEDKVFDALEIRDTSDHNSVISYIGEFTAETIFVCNGLDQEVTLQLQGSRDKSVWVDVGVPVAVTANTDDYDTVTDFFPYYRIQATCSTSPTSGQLDVWVIQARGNH